MVKKNLLTLSLLLALWGSSLAQSPTPTPKKVPTIFDYKAELSLTDEQVSSLKAEVKSLGENMAVERKKIGGLVSEYQTLVKGDPPLETVHAKLLAIFKEQGELRYLDYTTSRKIRQILKPDQLKKWRELQEQARKPK